MEQEDKICAVCVHQKLVILNTVCGNKAQKDKKLKSHTRYNSTCYLFEERPQDFYDSGHPIERK
jgi:hypothetical protein